MTILYLKPFNYLSPETTLRFYFIFYYKPSLILRPHLFAIDPLGPYTAAILPSFSFPNELKTLSHYKKSKHVLPSFQNALPILFDLVNSDLSNVTCSEWSFPPYPIT